MFRDYTNYEIYSDGRIYSYWTNKFLKPRTNKNGYQQVFMYDNEGKRKLYYIHRVVWEAVTGSPIPSNMQINHIDERKDNNARSNLELVSPKENCNFGTRNNRIGKSNSKSLKNNKKLSKSLTNNPKLSKPVGAFKNGELVLSLPSINEAARQGFNQGNVAACCRGERKTHKGFEWRYL